jgi:hypothetical protein
MMKLYVVEKVSYSTRLQWLLHAPWVIYYFLHSLRVQGKSHKGYFRIYFVRNQKY